MSGTIYYELAVIRGFGPYVVGDRISEPATVAAILAGPHYFRVVKVPVSGGTTAPAPTTGGTTGGAGATGATGATGPAGASVASAAINASGQLVFTRTDGVALNPITLPASAGGTAGPAGASVLTGAGAPAAALGASGESYIDTATFDFYKKTNGAWAKLGNIKGAAGAVGATGPQGPIGPAGPAGASATVADPATLPVFSGNFGDAEYALAVQGGNLVRLSGATLKAFLSGTTAATPAPVAPGQVTGLTAGTATTTSVPLTWTAPATGDTPMTYAVEYRIGTAAYTVANASVSTTSYTAAGLSASQVYEFRVRATNAAGSGAYSATVTKGTAAATATAPTTAPALTAGTPTQTAVPVTIGAVGGADASGYRVEYKRAADATYTTFTSSASAGAPINVTGLTAGTAYDFRAAASSGGAFGPISAVVSATTAAAAGGAIATAVLDGKPAPAFAYGFDRLLTSHTGGAVIASPAGSTAETVVGFTADGAFDEAALLALGADVELVGHVNQVAGGPALRVPSGAVRPKLVVGGAIVRHPGTGNRPGVLWSNSAAQVATATGIDLGADDATMLLVCAPRAADTTAGETNGGAPVLGIRPAAGAAAPPNASSFGTTDAAFIEADTSGTRLRAQRGNGSGGKVQAGVAITTAGSPYVAAFDVDPAGMRLETQAGTVNNSGVVTAGFSTATSGPLTAAGQVFVGGNGSKAGGFNGYTRTMIGFKGAVPPADITAIISALKTRVGA